MGRWWVVLVVAGCGTSAVVGTDGADGGDQPSDATPDASDHEGGGQPDAESPTDAGPDGTGPKADAGPALGRACNAGGGSPKCESLAATVTTICYTEDGGMHARCTFECWKSNPGPGDAVIPDPGKAAHCTQLGGTCTKLRQDGFYVCAVP